MKNKPDKKISDDEIAEILSDFYRVSQANVLIGGALVALFVCIIAGFAIIAVA